MTLREGVVTWINKRKGCGNIRLDSGGRVSFWIAGVRTPVIVGDQVVMSDRGTVFDGCMELQTGVRVVVQISKNNPKKAWRVAQHDLWRDAECAAASKSTIIAS